MAVQINRPQRARGPVSPLSFMVWHQSSWQASLTCPGKWRSQGKRLTFLETVQRAFKNTFGSGIPFWDFASHWFIMNACSKQTIVKIFIILKKYEGWFMSACYPTINPESRQLTFLQTQSCSCFLPVNMGYLVQLKWAPMRSSTLKYKLVTFVQVTSQNSKQ